MPSDTQDPGLGDGGGSRWRRRFTLALSAALVAVLLATAALARVATSSEPEQAHVLWVVATAFNRDYAANRPGAVYDRFDAASRAVISRGAYIRRHLECPDPPGAATTTGVARVRGGYWLVHYSIDGVTLTDYWRDLGGRWRFSLVRSNPDAVALYRLSFAAYARALGCTPRT